MRLPRVPLPGFVRRRPFPWALAATVVVAWSMVQLGMEWMWMAESDEGEAAAYAAQAAGLVLPLVATGVAWRRIGRWARASALAVCALWIFSTIHIADSLPGQVRAFVPNTRVVDEMLRAPRRAMRTPPDEAAARALAAGDTTFLAVGGDCGSIEGVDTATARRHGVRVISGTFHDGGALTAEHRRFGSAAGFYADAYNRAILERLGIEAGRGGCVDLRELRRGHRFFWP
jgi:hypothetical protein